MHGEQKTELTHPPGKIDFNSPVIQGLIRGMLPWYLLSLMKEGPMHALKMIEKIGAAGHGGWKPSPGSVYPILHKLEEEGKIEGDWERSKAAPRRIYALTVKGKKEATKMRHQLIEELHKAKYIIDSHISMLEQIEDQEKRP